MGGIKLWVVLMAERSHIMQFFQWPCAHTDRHLPLPFPAVGTSGKPRSDLATIITDAWRWHQNRVGGSRR